MKPVIIGDLIQQNNKRWSAMHIHPAIIPAADKVCKTLIASKDRFKQMTMLTHVPWAIIAVIASREYGFNKDGSLPWDKSLAQGDPWNAVSRHEPKGRGPFRSWEEAAYDALVNCSPYASKWKDWTVGGALTLLEKYNGLGYAMKGLPSPYIFAGTDQYIKGKYEADGAYNPFLVDEQIGCAVIIARMEVIENGKSS